jgi:hypothetical protein
MSFELEDTIYPDNKDEIVNLLYDKMTNVQNIVVLKSLISPSDESEL